MFDKLMTLHILQLIHDSLIQIMKCIEKKVEEIVPEYDSEVSKYQVLDK